MKGLCKPFFYAQFLLDKKPEAETKNLCTLNIYIQEIVIFPIITNQNIKLIDHPKFYIHRIDHFISANGLSCQKVKLRSKKQGILGLLN